MMTKTPLGRACNQRLNEINDQLCFGAFAAEELRVRVGPPELAPADATTSAMFPQNSHASRIDRKISELPQFEARAVSTLVGTALMAASEYVQSYCADAKGLGLELIGPQQLSVRDTGADGILAWHIASWGGAVPVAHLETIVYLRLRRNRLVHGTEKPSASWEAFLQKHAGRLRDFWAQSPTELFGFDFANPEVSRLSIEDGYAIMNLFRICLEEVDQAFASLIPAEPIAERVARDFVQSQPGLRGDWPRLTRKVRAAIEADYGYSFDSAALLSGVRRGGAAKRLLV